MIAEPIATYGLRDTPPFSNVPDFDTKEGALAYAERLSGIANVRSSDVAEGVGVVMADRGE